MATRIEPPFFPIIYVRGYAGSGQEVEETVATPYMGFNLGSTKIRQRWTGELRRFVFESPLVRLMKDHGYRDVYEGGDEVPLNEPIPPRSIVIYRYYDEVSASFGDAERPDIPIYAEGLGRLVEKVRDQVCGGDPEVERTFRVYLVGHSMGGLICRCFLQNPPPGTPAVQELVDKVFTYATPHNGIDLQVIGNVPGFFSRNNANNFNRQKMSGYLGLPPGTDRVDSLGGEFDADRFFTLIGTNHRDYGAASGWARRVVGPMSDGLVRIANASVQGAPRAFVHRSHSGDYGIVNSEEGFQNLTRFLFGDMRVDGILDIHDLTLPPELDHRREEGAQVRASYHIEVVVRPRGARYDLSRRTVSESSAKFVKYDEIFHPGRVDRARARKPHLFSTFLSARHRTRARGALVFSVELRVLVPEYEIDGLLFDHHIEGSYLFRETFHIAADRDDDGEWDVRYGLDSATPGRPSTREAERRDVVADAGFAAGAAAVFAIPVQSGTRPGIDATLLLKARPWNGKSDAVGSSGSATPSPEER